MYFIHSIVQSLIVYIYIIAKAGEGIIKGACVQMCFLSYRLFIYLLLLSITVFVCHHKGNGFLLVNFC